MFKKIVQFSHNDLDGYACNVVSRAFSLILHAEGHCNIAVENHNCDYGSVDSIIHDRLTKTLNNEFDETLFIVSDISWKSEYITEVFKNTKWFIFADHHRSSEALGKELSRYDRYGYRISESEEGDECGSVKLFRLFEELCFENGVNLFPRWSESINNIAVFLDIVNRWDLWTWEDDVKQFNKINAYALIENEEPILNAYLDFFLQGVTGENTHNFTDYMVELVVNSPDFKKDLSRLISGTDGFIEYLRNQATMIENTCNHYQRVPLPMPIGPDIEALVFLCPTGITNKSLVSVLAYNKLKDRGITDYDCLLIHEIGSNTVSLRYPTSEDIDLSFVAKYNYLAKDNTGGGHPFAAGFPIDGDMFVDNLLINKKLWRL